MTVASKSAPMLFGQPARFWLAILIVPTCIVGMIALAWHVIDVTPTKKDAPNHQLETAKYIFSAILPLLGTWVGIVLTFYFTRDNFESAGQETRAALELAKGPADLHYTGIVSEKMRPRNQMTIYMLPDGMAEAEVELTALTNKMVGPISRLPVLNQSKTIRYLIHKSLITEYLSQTQGQYPGQSPGQTQTQNPSLLDFLDHENNRANVGLNAVAFVAIDGTLEDARASLREKAGSQDVIVTQTGTSDEPILGWLTNNDLANSL